MINRIALLRFFLWWAVLGLALWVGGTVFNMLVIVPLWSASPPESVRSFFTGTGFNATIWNFFGPPWMVARLLPIAAALALSWPLRAHRRLLLVTMACMALAVVFTLLYVYPINAVLFAQAGGTAAPDEVAALVRRWVLADRLRCAVGLMGFVALLQAFRLPLARDREVA